MTHLCWEALQSYILPLAICLRKPLQTSMVVVRLVNARHLYSEVSKYPTGAYLYITAVPVSFTYMRSEFLHLTFHTPKICLILPTAIMASKN